MKEAFEKIIEKLIEMKIVRVEQCHEDYEIEIMTERNFDDAIKIVNQVADIYGGEELHDRNKIYDYIKTQINPYGKPFQGSVKEFGYKIMDYIENMSDLPEINVGEIEEFCEWKRDNDEFDVYDTKCKNRHVFFEGSPIDNEYEFCPYCGKKIKVVE